MRTLVAAIAIAATAGPQSPPARTTAVLVRTALGEFQIDVDEARAPVTAADFLRYVDGGHYDGGVFHRTVTLANQPNDAVEIEVIQAGVNPARAGDRFPAIALERTNQTGLSHTDGTVSMARNGPDTARSDFSSASTSSRGSISAAAAIPTVRGSPRSAASRAAWTSSAGSTARRTPMRNASRRRFALKP